MEQDKMFNLQLTIQKLQEEVSLYRNGADGDELFQLIAEKENEISGLKASNSVKNDSLKKLAKKSAEVLARCDRLQSDYDTLQFEHSDLIQEKKSLIIQLDVLKSASTRLSTHFEEKKVIVDRLEEELTSRDLSIEKLLGRCAALVSQKNEKQKEFEAETKQFAAERSEKNKQMKELMDELERAMRYNTEGKERLNKEHAKSLDLSSQLQLSQNELQAMSVANNLLREVEATHLAKIQELMDNKVALESELSKESNFLAAATSKTSVVEDQLESIVKGRDFEIIELNQKMEALLESAAADSRALQEERRADNSRNKLEVEGLVKKLRALEKERDLLLQQRNEIDLLKVKNGELEEKIKRQDQYMKSRLLKDKSNFGNSLCAPEPSEPSHRPPTSRALSVMNDASAALMPSAAPSADVRTFQAVDKGIPVKTAKCQNMR